MNYSKINIRLSELAEIFTGFNYNRKLISGKSSGILFIQGKDINNNYLSDENIYKLKLEYINPKFILQNNDILFSAKGSRNFAFHYIDSIGKAAASSTFFIVRVYEDIIMPEYLTWYLNWKTAQNYFKSESKGTFIPSINKSQLGDLEIPIPDFELQKKVITIDRLRKIERDLVNKIEHQKDFLTESILNNIINKSNE